MLVRCRFPQRPGAGRTDSVVPGESLASCGRPAAASESLSAAVGQSDRAPRVYGQIFGHSALRGVRDERGNLGPLVGNGLP